VASQSVENYVKCIFSLQSKQEGGVSTNAIAERLETKASSVSDMLKKLKSKKLVNYEKYKGATLTTKGRDMAVNIIRKHRLWEVFLVDNLHFGWDEVHDIAEQMEHVQSPKLTNRLEEYLGFPRFDPHGDPIPDKDGKFEQHARTLPLSEMGESEEGKLVGVLDTSTEFLQYLKQMNLKLGVKMTVGQVFEYDKSLEISTDNRMLTLSQQVASNLLIQPKQ
jgi:DtxR family Mn-dependent transcriptional regulator